MNEKLALIAKIFTDTVTETLLPEDVVKTPLQQGGYYGGIVNGRKFMYSTPMIQALSLEKLEKVIRSQTGL